MTTGFFDGHILRGLAFRVLLFLTLALLPIGLIAVVQTREITRQTSDAARLALLAVTEQAVSSERVILQQAFGAARVLSSMVRVIADDRAQCSAFMEAYQEASDHYAVVGFTDTRGIMSCASTGNTYNFAQDPSFQAALEYPQRSASAGSVDPLSPGATVTVMEPVLLRDELLGFVSISIPNRAFSESRDIAASLQPLSTVTFNKRGELLTSIRDWDLARAVLPAGWDLADLASQERSIFSAQSEAGPIRYYAVLPVVPGAVYALSVWPEDTPTLQTDLSSRASGLLPVAMWLASLVVAFWALNRLAIKHIRKLGRQMRRFARNRTLPQNPLSGSVPTEIFNMEEAFVVMAESILRDEAALEDSLREKNILLKEVHHRVKNNLQLISSIMNMQIRKADSAESKRVLQRLQERILGLATIHKTLYLDADVSAASGSTMLREIVNQALSIGIAPGSNVEVKQEYDDVVLEPDDAAPLSLLVSEALTNALKYVSAGPDGRKTIAVTLKFLDEERARLCVSNSSGTEIAEEGTGLGTTLIHAFARQLNGQTEVIQEDHTYTLRLDFPVSRKRNKGQDF